VRQRGYALDDRENQADMRCVAVPMLDQEGRAVAALSATDSAERMTEAWQEHVRDALFDTAAALRHKLYPVITPIQNRRPLAAE
jgi:DNA-binding IclR family transcriptional regulator